MTTNETNNLGNEPEPEEDSPDFPPAATAEARSISLRLLPKDTPASRRHPFVRPIHGRMGGGFRGWGHEGPHF